jgi:hypothetical protein
MTADIDRMIVVLRDHLERERLYGALDPGDGQVAVCLRHWVSRRFSSNCRFGQMADKQLYLSLPFQRPHRLLVARRLPKWVRAKPFLSVRVFGLN